MRSKTVLIIIVTMLALGVYVGMGNAIQAIAPDVTSSFIASEEARNSWWPALSIAGEAQGFIVANTGAIVTSITVLLFGVDWALKR